MGNYLANRRRELGYTQKEVAEIVGVTEATVSRWESGTIANMRRDKIKLLADALSTTANFIMTGEMDPPFPQKRTNDFSANILRDFHDYECQERYREATSFDKDGTKSTVRNLFLCFSFEVRQYDEDIAEGMVSIQRYGSEEHLFRIPEHCLFDRDDLCAQMVEILSYMPEDTPKQTSEKLRCLLIVMNDSGIKKTLSYVCDLMDNKKYHENIKQHRE